VADTPTPVACSTSVKLEVVTVEAAIASENVAVTAVSSATSTAPAAGLFETRVGVDDGAGAAVVNVQLFPASGVPSDALIVAARLAVYVVLAASAALGVSFAVFVVVS
jgi:hypothetical protein